MDFPLDTAVSAGPAALPSLLAFAAPGHVLYGSGLPMLPEDRAVSFDGGLDDRPLREPGRLDAVGRGNAERRFPRPARS